MQTLAIHVNDIEIGERHRALSTDAVTRLAASMDQIGLKQPITIRITDDVMIDNKPCDGVPMLVAGAHRLAAAKSLGWSHIDCLEVEDDPITAELWEIAENLHRCDLNVEQRHAHLRRYVELVEARLAAKPVHDGQVSVGGRGNKTAVRIAAEETGVSLNTVKRATGQLAPQRRVIEVPDQLDHDDQIELQVRSIMAAWNRACPEARDAFLERVGTPVMDRAA